MNQSAAVGARAGTPNRAGIVTKRVFDLLVAGLLFVVTLPVMAVLALAVKLFGGPGPVIFRGARVGRDGVEFRILKFRTMKLGSETGAQVTAGRDSRITTIGRILRMTKLDELPQLWNVVKGDMSVVGPRPEAPVFVERYTPEQRRVLSVRPGITGAATLEYRNEEDVLAQLPAEDREAFYEDRLLPQQLAVELEYLDHWTLGRDISLVVRTATAVVTGLGLGRPSAPADRQTLPKGHLVPRSAVPLAAIDLTMWLFGLSIMIRMRHGYVLNEHGEHLWTGALVVGAELLVVGFLTGIYRGRFAIGRYQEAGAVAATQALIVLVYVAGFTVWGTGPVGRATVTGAAYWSVVPMLGARYGFRYWRSRRVQPPSAFSERVLIFGAGRGAHQIIPSMLFDASSRYRPVAIIEDDPNKRFRSVEGVRVVGNRDVLAQAAARYGVTKLVIAVPSASEQTIREVARLAEEAGLDVLMLPPASDLLVPVT